VMILLVVAPGTIMRALSVCGGAPLGPPIEEVGGRRPVGR
jgi:hypothetical protein